MIGHDNAKVTDMLQTGIMVENDDEVKILQVRTENGRKDGGSVVTPIRSGAQRVKQEIGFVVK